MLSIRQFKNKQGSTLFSYFQRYVIIGLYLRLYVSRVLYIYSNILLLYDLNAWYDYTYYAILSGARVCHNVS